MSSDGRLSGPHLYVDFLIVVYIKYFSLWRPFGGWSAFAAVAEWKGTWPFSGWVQ